MRRQALCAAAAFGAGIVLSVEALGAAGALHRWTVGALWCAAALAVARHGLPRPAWRRPFPFEVFAGGLLAAIAGVTLALALVAPPNSVDAFGYHLSRVVFWAQAGSAHFFPTHYFNQLSMPPMAEYAMLHGWLLASGDRLANLPQWFGFVGSALAASLAAGALGAGARGQWLAAVFWITLPGAVLQASGAKNDCVLALWLLASAYFALRWSERPNRADALWTGLAFALALATKGTAYLFAPAALACALAPDWRRYRGRLASLAGAAALCAALLNGPHWVRNLDLSGSPLGYASAAGDARYDWRNDRVGWRGTASNAVRHLSQQLGGRGEGWNRAVYEAALAAHRALAIQPEDPAATWPGTRFDPPRASNHEADAPNRLHLALAAASCLALALGRRRRALAFALAPAAAFLLACAALKYQPHMARLFVPLFALAAPAAGLAGERLRPAVLQWVLALLLADGARLPLLENWTRPLRGAASVLHATRTSLYFRDMDQFDVSEADYRRAAEWAAADGCRTVGIDNGQFQLEYPLQALLLERDRGTRFVHTAVRNRSAKYGGAGPAPCAVVCLGCTGVREKLEAYREWSEPREVNRFLVYRRGGRSGAATSAPAAAISASVP